MKIAHTSDWHIGKKLNMRSRLDEQREVLKELTQICDEQRVDVVIVAGDVFDTFTPSAEAEQVFYNAINELASPDRAVIIISGNHDDGQRLCASNYIASKANVYIFGGENTPEKGGVGVRAEAVGKNYITVTDGRSSVYFGVLPYPTEQRLGEKRSELSYPQRVEQWIEQCFSANVNGYPQILVSHLFMLGGVGSDGERQIELGGARVIDKKSIPSSCVYTALGHLHKPQIIDSERHVLYSGSLLQYSFDEANTQKGVSIFEVIDGAVANYQRVDFKGGKSLVNLTANGFEGAKQLLEKYPDELVHLTINLTGVLSDLENKELHGSYPSLVQLDLKKRADVTGGDVVSRRSLSAAEAFRMYYKSKYSEDVPQDIMDSFLEIYNGEGE